MKPLPPLVEYLKTEVLGCPSNAELTRDLNLSTATLTGWRKKIGGLTKILLIIIKVIHRYLPEYQERQVRKELNLMLKNLAKNRENSG